MRIILTRGIPASGKTTWAVREVRENPNCVRVNRDDIRESVFGAAYHDQDPDPQSEREIDELELALVRRALADGYDVIVDATHLDKATVQKWRNFAEALGSAIGPMDFPIPFAEAKRRNSERARSVPESVWKRCLRSWDPTDQSPFGRNKGVGALTHVSKEHPGLFFVVRQILEVDPAC